MIVVLLFSGQGCVLIFLVVSVMPTSSPVIISLSCLHRSLKSKGAVQLIRCVLCCDLGPYADSFLLLVK